MKKATRKFYVIKSLDAKHQPYQASWLHIRGGSEDPGYAIQYPSYEAAEKDLPYLVEGLYRIDTIYVVANSEEPPKLREFRERAEARGKRTMSNVCYACGAPAAHLDQQINQWVCAGNYPICGMSMPRHKGTIDGACCVFHREQIVKLAALFDKRRELNQQLINALGKSGRARTVHAADKQTTIVNTRIEEISAIDKEIAEQHGAETWVMLQSILSDVDLSKLNAMEINELIKQRSTGLQLYKCCEVFPDLQANVGGGAYRYICPGCGSSTFWKETIQQARNTWNNSIGPEK